jgi:YHS domain-containing protein
MAIATKLTGNQITRRSSMKLRLQQIVQQAVLILVGSVATVFASDVAISTPGLSGYDPVAYFTDGKAVRGSGYHVAVQNGETYVFASEEHVTLFKQSPDKYLPAYGGYCDKSIQQKWEKDIPGFIMKAEKHWDEIKDKKASDL